MQMIDDPFIMLLQGGEEEEVTPRKKKKPENFHKSSSKKHQFPVNNLMSFDPLVCLCVCVYDCHQASTCLHLPNNIRKD